MAVALAMTVRAQAGDPRAILADPAFASSYKAQYGFLDDTSLLVLTEEFRAAIEDAAAGGSKVGSTPTSHKVRGFERMLLRGIKDALCGGGTKAGAESTQSVVVRSIAAASSDSGLSLATPAVGRVSAITVRIIEKSDRARLCQSATLSELPR